MKIVDLRPQDYEATRLAIARGAELSWAYMIMNALAAVIATYGLFANSPAVIIGAMVVAMLLGPITGVGLSLVDADMPLLGRSLGSLVVGGLGVIGVAAGLGLIHREMPITPEIISRTTPDVADLMIALAGGAAGAFATVSPSLSGAFVGVAIATALVPPLCAATVLLVRGEYALAGGAYLLTLTNIVGIQFANSLVLWLAGFRGAAQVRGIALRQVVWSNLVTLILMTGLSVDLTFNLQTVIAREVFESAVRHRLDELLAQLPGTRVADVRFEARSRHVFVQALTRGPVAPTTRQVAAIEAQLPKPRTGSLELRLRFVETKTIGRDSPSIDEQFAPAERLAPSR